MLNYSLRCETLLYFTVFWHFPLVAANNGSTQKTAKLLYDAKEQRWGACKHVTRTPLHFIISSSQAQPPPPTHP